MNKSALTACVFATLASTALMGCNNGSICNLWALNASDSVTVTRGSFGVVTINTGAIVTTGASIGSGANAVPTDMTVERFNSTEFHIFAETTTPAGVYQLQIAGSGGTGSTCANSVAETITVTVN